MTLLVPLILVVACGARTGEDEFFGFDGSGVGGVLGSGATPGAGSGAFGGRLSGGTGGVAAGGRATGGFGNAMTSGGGTGGSLLGSCCSTADTPGCALQEVQNCVCEVDDFCCNTAWDQFCVQNVVDWGCGTCQSGGGGTVSTGGIPSTGGVSPAGGTVSVGGGMNTGGLGAAPGTGSCCTAHVEQGCSEPSVSDCVCEFDPYCCEVRWDELCVAYASGCGAMCSGSGGAGGGAGDCCRENGTPLCENEEITSCVCDFDAFCCDEEWDDICVVEAHQYCGAMCTGGTGGLGTGGMVGTGASGGANQCTFEGECTACACDECSEEFEACATNEECATIYECVRETGCSATDCFDADACGTVISENGGLFGIPAGLAFDAVACGVELGCPCP